MPSAWKPAALTQSGQGVASASLSGKTPAPPKPELAAASENLLLDLWTEQPPIADVARSHQTFPYLTPPLVDGKVECAVQALRLGDVALVGVAGEAFVEIGLAVKARSPIPHTIFLGYTNGCLGYIPTTAAYKPGGYEVHRAHAVYRLPHTIAPDSADRIITTSLKLLGELIVALALRFLVIEHQSWSRRNNSQTAFSSWLKTAVENTIDKTSLPS